MKNMVNEPYVIRIEIFRDRAQGLLRLSHKASINKVLEIFGIEKKNSVSVLPIQKGDKLSLMQCLKNELKCKQMEKILYACIVRSLMYA